MKTILKFAAGPAAFLFVYVLPLGGLSPDAKVVLAVFGWMILWWITNPIPWAITALLPLALFPILRLMSINATAAIYGQTIFFWIWGTVLMGYALDRHGLARRFALWFMALPGVGGHSLRLAFVYMFVTGLISMVVSDAATVAMMMPVGMSLIFFSRSVAKDSASNQTNFAAFIALGTLYGAVSGGTATLAGLPHNKLSADILAELTGRTLGWFEWMKVGVPVFLASIIVLYIILRIFLPPEFSELPGGEEFLRKEKAKLGGLTRGERTTLFVFGMMVLLFTLPTILEFTLGLTHPVTVWSRMGLSLNVVPPIVILLLFCTPVDLSKGEFVLGWRETISNTPWNAMMLCTAAAGVVAVLVGFGLDDSLGAVVSDLGLGRYSLPYVSALITAFVTNFMSGVAATALFGSILIPAAEQIGWNPASMAVMLPNVAMGVAMPWAGATAATAFASGAIELKTMIRLGLIATLIFTIVITTIHILMAPIL